MPPSGPVYQPTTVTYEQQDNWTPVSYISQTVSNVNRSKCIQWLILVAGLCLLAIGLIMVIEGAVEYNDAESIEMPTGERTEVEDQKSGSLVIAVIGAILCVIAVGLLGLYAWNMRRRKGCPCFPSKEQRHLDSHAGNGQILTLNPSTDLLVTAQYGPPSEIAYQPPAVVDEEETRKLMGSDNKEWSNPSFDVVFTESLYYQSYYGLIHKPGSSPIIGLLSIGEISAMFDAVGNPNNPAYDPDMAIPYSDHMTFWQQLHNTLYAYWIRYHWYYEIMPDEEAVIREYFGSTPPPVWETERNFSMMMVNNHWSMNYVRPAVPAYIELGSLHLQKEVKPLPKGLKKFPDVEGVIYFSLGSNIRSDKMTPAKVAEFMTAFAELPQ